MKLKATAKTKLYELTYLVPGDLTDSELTKVQETVQALVKKHKGAIKSEDVWGKKTLAYDIRRASKSYKEAHYIYLVIEMNPAIAPIFEKDIYLENAIIRHLLVEAESVEAETVEKIVKVAETKKEDK